MSIPIGISQLHRIYGKESHGKTSSRQLKHLFAEIERHMSSHLILQAGGTYIEITPQLLADLLREFGYRKSSIAPYIVTVPRRGWAVLTPRPVWQRRRRGRPCKR
jgi:hypothetical protein